MDPLDKQFSKIKLLNDYSLPTGVCPESVYNDGVTTGTFLPIEVSPKKIGPAVPPKPSKKNSMFPEVPQSIIVKQTCEPLYSKRLQSESVFKDMTKATKSPGKNILTSGASVPVLHRPPLNSAGHHIYSNNKITLDNPAILDQQLEALEYHKKQLEKKGLLQNIPKLSTTSFGNGITTTNQVSNTNEYSNVQTGPGGCATSPSVDKQNEISNVYSNIHSSKRPFAKNDGSTLVYGNILCGNNDDLPPPPTLEVSSPLTINDPTPYMNHCSAPDDDIPPPPSPVSSSYSELRRATDIFPKLPSYPIISYGTNSNVKSGTRFNNLDNAAVQAVGLSNCEPRNLQQTYINVVYHQTDCDIYGSPNSQKSLNQTASDYYGYGSSSQGSSTYESLYEPINPRPPSHLSLRANYLPYTYINSPQVSEENNCGTETVTGGNEKIIRNSLVMSHSNGKMQNHKEVEVETLTDLLVHSMDAGADADNFGICVACNERIVGENSGCTAMDLVYHIACFTCSQCQINLQGKPFYALDGKPYCEADYLNTLEKCSVCMKPILERILRATGKPYHPQCFTCVVCGNSLDGIPFTVDATNQNYCIADFHKKFAPRCCVCKLPIMPEPGQEETVRVVALDRSFHFECYKCEDCGLLLSSEAEGRGCYPLDDHVLCKSCNAKRVQMLTSRMTTEL